MYNEFRSKLNKAKDDPDRLGPLLIDNIKSIERFTDELESIYIDYLLYNDSYVKQAALFGLLYRIKSTDQNVKETALKFALDKSEEFSLRQVSITGLSIVYFGSNDIDLIRGFVELLNDVNESFLIRNTSFDAILELVGVSKIRFINRFIGWSSDKDYIKTNEAEFENEFKFINKIIGLSI